MTEQSLLQRRVDGTYSVDEWGLDPDLVRFVSPVFALRWQVTVDGDDLIPERGPALLVFNRRAGLSEPFVLSRGVRQATDRHVRVAGVPDLAPVGPLLRRLGGVLERPDEIAGLLRADHLVGVALGRSLRRQLAGPAPAALLSSALATSAPVLPVAVTGREVGRRWQVTIGPPIEAPASRGPLAAEELADRARSGVQELLDEEFPPGRFRT
jgi:1-acyl-sn-glycerol-3-phosphate acyltransferase